MPHGHCFFWQSDILWLHVLSDGAIALAYFALPFTLAQLVRKRKDLAFNWIFLLFSLFILLCGITHVMDIAVLWHPYYRLQGMLKLATALASIPTAILLLRLVPKAALIPSIAEYEKAASYLETEIRKRQVAEDDLRKVNASLETRVAQRTEELRRSEELFRVLTESLPQLVWSSRPDGHLAYFNQRWFKFAGIDPDSRDREDWSELLHPDEVTAVMTEWRRVLATGEDFQMEFRMREGRTGRYQWFLSLARPLRDEAGEVVRWFGTCTGIDDQKKTAESLLRANRDLEHFAYAASHDLQEPLRTIMLYAQLIQKRNLQQLDEDGRSALESIVHGAGRMSALLHDLRSYLRSAQPANEDLPLISGEDVLRKVLEDVKAATEESGASVTADRLPELRADPWHLTQIFQNLIVNAIKYRGPRRPAIHVGVDTSLSQWTFSVSDNGEGIDAGHRQTIFETFHRLHGQSQSGSGLGLAICARIVENYRGKIWVDSHLGIGSVFYFTVPDAQPPIDA